MRRIVVLLALLLAFARPAAAIDDRVRLYDLSADTLPVQQSELGLFWGRYARGILPNLQVHTHLGGDALTLVNVFAKYRFLDKPQLRASVEAGLIWPAITLLGAGQGSVPLLLWVPLELRTSIPVGEETELSVAWIYRAVVTSISDSSFGQSSLRQEATLLRYDPTGAWYVTGRFPLLVRSQTSLKSFLGKSDVSGVLTLDDLASWGALVGREFLVGQTGHLRLGVGYRNTPGILFYESIGHLLVNVDLYWR